MEVRGFAAGGRGDGVGFLGVGLEEMGEWRCACGVGRFRPGVSRGVWWLGVAGLLEF